MEHKTVYDFCFDEYTFADALEITMAYMLAKMTPLVGMPSLLRSIAKFTNVDPTRLPIHEALSFVEQFNAAFQEYVLEHGLIQPEEAVKDD